MYESINEQLKNHFYQNDTIQSLLALKEKQVLNDEISPFAAAQFLLDTYEKE
jgi:LAO/AO transport system kinase